MTETAPTIDTAPSVYGPPPGAAKAVIIAVVDGDTVTVDFGTNQETIRLLGIDTPEKPGGPRPAECYGQEATDFATDLLPAGTPVLLSRDEAARDLYGRLLAYVHRADDDLFINLALLDQGYAAPLAIAPNDAYTRVFAQHSTAAKRARVGLWAACGGPDVLLDDR